MTLMDSEEFIRDAILNSSTPKAATEGIRLIPENNPTAKRAKTVEFDDLKVRKRTTSDIAKWVPGHFVSCAKGLYEKRYGKDWGLNFTAQCSEVLRVKDSLVERLGFCDNIALRDYICWFFDNCADGFMQRASGFYFSQMRHDWVLEKFCNGYNYRRDLTQEPHKDPAFSLPIQKTTQDSLFDEERMSAAFLLDDESFVCDYGIIVAVCWLVSRRGFTLRDAVKYVYIVSDKLSKKGEFQRVREATERYNPYPPNVLFLDADRLAKKVNPGYEVNVRLEKGALSSLPWLTSKV